MEGQTSLTDDVRGLVQKPQSSLNPINGIPTHASGAPPGNIILEEANGIEEGSLSIGQNYTSCGQYGATSGLFIISQEQSDTVVLNSSPAFDSQVQQQNMQVEGGSVVVNTSYRVNQDRNPEEFHDKTFEACVDRYHHDKLPTEEGKEERRETFECKLEKQSEKSACSRGPGPTQQALSSQSLDDYIDIVTTYKCKFCLFSCGWKSGLKSHIRNCHLNSKTPKSVSETTSSSRSVIPKSSRSLLKTKETFVRTKSAPFIGGRGENSKEMSEQHIFLCGECSKGFGTFDQCRKHMVEDHQLNLPGASSDNRREPKEEEEEEEEETEKQLEDEEYQAQLEEDDDQDALFDRAESKKVTGRAGSKRSVKPPRVLQADFLLDSKKKRESKENTSDKPYRCSEVGCGCRFLTEANLEYHTQCHAGEDNTFDCPECGNKFDQWRPLLLHLWKEHLLDLDLLTCSECGYKTYSQFKLDTHQKIHSDARNYMCSTCGKCFKQLSQLRNHNVMHLDRSQVGSNGQKRWYNTQQCETCGRNFSDSKCLRKHQQAVHCKIKPYICNFCGHTSARKAMLQLHMRQHTGERPFSCEHCDYKTGDHNSLRRHRMRHTGSKPYKCPHCTYSCIQAISLKTHLKKKHPGSEGLFSCTLCGFRSVNRDNFAHHMSDHQRGIIPATDKAATVEKTPQLKLAEGSVQEGLPGNMVSAQLICSCLNVLTQDGETVDLPPGCITVGENGTQTITIQIPTNADQETGEQYYFTIQQDLTPGSVTQLGLLENGELKLADEEDQSVSNYTSSQPISALQQEGTS